MFRCKCDLNLLKIIHRVITSMLKDRMDKLLVNYWKTQDKYLLNLSRTLKPKSTRILVPYHTFSQAQHFIFSKTTGNKPLNIDPISN